MDKTPALLAVVACLLAVSCSGPERPPVAVAPAPAPPVPAAKPEPAPAVVAPAGIERQVVDEFLDAINGHSPDRAAALLADKVTYFDSFSGQIYRDRKAAEEGVLKLYLNAIPNEHWEIRSEPAAGNGSIAYEWTLTGTNTGAWGGIGASGQKVQLKGISFVRVQDGKIVYKADYFDTTVLGKQLGWQ